MHIIAIAAVALCPVLIQAQVNSPAPTQSAGQKTVLESRLAAPKAPGVSTDGTSVPVKHALRVSSGVVYPKLLEKVNIAESSAWHWRASEEEKLAVVKFFVDKDGKPSQVTMVQSIGPGMDNDVLASVSRYRFKAGTLNDEPTPIEVELTVQIQNPHTESNSF
jgi:outer membrane biosynthesis protein TonB